MGHAVELAQRAVDLSRDDPAAARAMAMEALADGTGAADFAAVAVALRALGLAAREEGRMADARAALVEAVRAAGEHRLPVEEGLARGSLASVLLALGDAGAALAELDAARPLLAGKDAALVDMQRAVVLERTGDVVAAGAAFDRAVATAREAGDEVAEALVLANRGLALAYRNELDRAEADLARAEVLFEQQGMALFAADTRHNRGFVAARAGDVLGALARFEGARREHDALGVARPSGWLDEASVLLGVRLCDEAADLAARAARELAAGGQSVDAAEALLVVARAHLLAGRPADAAAVAAQAGQALREQGRTHWALLADALGVRAAIATAAPPPPGDLVALADGLDGAGWQDEADELSLAAAMTAVAAGAPAAGDLAARVETRLASRRPSLRAAVTTAHASALAALASGDLEAASAAVERGLSDAHGSALALGTLELQTAGASAAVELASVGVEIALRRGDAGAVFDAVERHRAATSAPLVAPAAVVHDRALAAELAALRDVSGRLDAADLPAEEVADLERQREALERAIARRSRAADIGRAGGAPPAALRAADLGARLGGAVALQVFEHRGAMLAVVLTASGASMAEVGTVTEVGELVRAVRFGVNRLLSPRTGGRAAAFAAAAAASIAALDARFAPLVRGHDRVVVIPAGALHALPWLVLPSLAGVAVAVAPSASAWAAGAAGTPGGDVLLVVGPDVDHDGAERAAVLRHWPQARVVAGRDATVARVRAELGRAGLAHLVVHGRFRADSPMFSSLRLADGPLTLHDLERGGGAPPAVVLTACDVGASDVNAGGAVLGMVGAMSRAGVRSLVASVLPVPEAASAPFADAVHAALAGGAPPARAVAVASEVGPFHGPSSVRIAPFVCFGG